MFDGSNSLSCLLLCEAAHFVMRTNNKPYFRESPSKAASQTWLLIPRGVSWSVCGLDGGGRDLLALVSFCPAGHTAAFIWSPKASSHAVPVLQRQREDSGVIRPQRARVIQGPDLWVLGPWRSHATPTCLPGRSPLASPLSRPTLPPVPPMAASSQGACCSSI